MSGRYRRSAAFCWGLAVVLAFFGGVSNASPFGESPPGPPPQLAIWCEFLPYVEVEPWLPTLARYNCALLLHVGREDLGRPDLVRLCRAAHKQGVEVQAWFLLPYEEHLYVGEATVEQIRSLALDFAAWSRAEQLGVEWVIFDCEPSPLLGGKLFDAVRRGRIWALRRLLRDAKDPAQFLQSIDGLNTLIEELHEQGMKVMGSGNRIFLDFLDRNNTTIQDALNAPFTMIHWDRVSFITYRYGAPQGVYVAMLRRYARLAHRFFGSRAALDVGLLGDHRQIPEQARRAELFGAGRFFLNFLSGMRSVFDVQEAAGAARGGGVDRIHLYSLDGAIESVAGLDYWLHAARDSRPTRGWYNASPFVSFRLGLFSLMLDGLFRSCIGRAVESEMGPPPPVGGEGQ